MKLPEPKCWRASGGLAMPDYSKQLVIADRVAAMELTDPVQLVASASEIMAAVDAQSVSLEGDGVEATFRTWTSWTP